MAFEKFKDEIKQKLVEGVYKRTLQYYENDIEDIKSLTPKSPDFEIKLLNDQDLEKFDNKWENVAYIFFAKELPECVQNAEQAKIFFDELNERAKKGNCMPKINTDFFDVHAKHDFGVCLYVGCCKDKTKTRMTHHLGKLSGTFGLHIDEWQIKRETISIYALIFGENIADEYLSVIEDILWEEYKPLFGKKGQR
jgi:hypothetical protein